MSQNVKGSIGDVSVTSLTCVPSGTTGPSSISGTGDVYINGGLYIGSQPPTTFPTNVSGTVNCLSISTSSITTSSITTSSIAATTSTTPINVSGALTVSSSITAASITANNSITANSITTSSIAATTSTTPINITSALTVSSSVTAASINVSGALTVSNSITTASMVTSLAAITGNTSVFGGIQLVYAQNTNPYTGSNIPLTDGPYLTDGFLIVSPLGSGNYYFSLIVTLKNSGVKAYASVQESYAEDANDDYMGSYGALMLPIPKGESWSIIVNNGSSGAQWNPNYHYQIYWVPLGTSN